MTDHEVDNARNTLVFGGHTAQAAGAALGALPCPGAQVAGQALAGAGRAFVRMADTVCDQDRGVATRPCRGT